jgi:NADP-dependent 3-hydroxy acid dehydrogenase YdfG
MTVLVVGASSGIGRATALFFAREGSRVMAAARREDLLVRLREEGSGHGLAIAVADVSDPHQMERLAQAADPIDVMVYAAGTNTTDRALKHLSIENWQTTLDVNLNGAYYITRAVLPGMRARGSGHLIYVSSIGGIYPDASGAAYQASKRGLLALAHATRIEEKENGIRTCVVCPGFTDTALIEKRPVKPTPEMLKHALQPEDIAETIVAIAKLPARAAVPEIHIVPARL